MYLCRFAYFCLLIVYLRDATSNSQCTLRSYNEICTIEELLPDLLSGVFSPKQHCTDLSYLFAANSILIYPRTWGTWVDHAKGATRPKKLRIEN